MKSVNSENLVPLRGVFSEEELQLWAQRLTSCLGLYDWILLEGEMGAGKSTLARALLAEWGVRGVRMTSPTFPVVQEFALSASNEAAGSAFHMDLYRLRSEEDLQETGVEEILWQGTGRVIVEWASLWPSLWADLHRGNPRGRLWVVTLNFLENVDDPEMSRRKFEVHCV